MSPFFIIPLANVSGACRRQRRGQPPRSALTQVASVATFAKRDNFLAAAMQC